MGWDWGLGFLSKNDDITSLRGSLKVLISWRNHMFSDYIEDCDIKINLYF